MDNYYFWIGDADREKPLREFNDGVAKERKKWYDLGYRDGMFFRNKRDLTKVY